SRDWSSDVCSSDLCRPRVIDQRGRGRDVARADVALGGEHVVLRLREERLLTVARSIRPRTEAVVVVLRVLPARARLVAAGITVAEVLAHVRVLVRARVARG